MIEVRQTEIFANWFVKLRDKKAKVRIDRMEMENFSDVDPVGQGVSEMTISHDTGYRVYFRPVGK